MVSIDSEVELTHAQCLAMDTLKSVPGVLQDPPGTVLIQNLGDSNVTLSVRAWVNQRTHDLLEVHSEAIRLFKQSYDQAGIVMPEPIYRVVMSEAKHPTSPSAPDSPTAQDVHTSKYRPASQQNTESLDTSADSSVEDTLDAEIRKSG